MWYTSSFPTCCVDFFPSVATHVIRPQSLSAAKPAFLSNKKTRNSPWTWHKVTISMTISGNPSGKLGMFRDDPPDFCSSKLSSILSTSSRRCSAPRRWKSRSDHFLDPKCFDHQVILSCWLDISHFIPIISPIHPMYGWLYAMHCRPIIYPYPHMC